MEKEEEEEEKRKREARELELSAFSFKTLKKPDGCNKRPNRSHTDPIPTDDLQMEKLFFFLFS